MQVHEAIVKGLEGIGVGTAFGGNGENVASLTLALKHSEKIRPIMTRHEQAASITRWAVPHYSPSPDGVIDGIVEMVEERFRNE
jgi:glyoxylate carboligase